MTGQVRCVWFGLVRKEHFSQNNAPMLKKSNERPETVDQLRVMSINYSLIVGKKGTDLLGPFTAR